MKLFRSCVVVASNSERAAEIRARIAARREAGLYPREIDFIVLSDPDAGRIGSGGAAILAAQELCERLDGGEAALVINAGGESRRMPAYSPEGKLFAPLPLATSTQIPPVVLDLQLDLFLRYPWNDGEMIVTSGDVVIDFDTTQLPADRGDLYGFAKPESFELGSEHGVFRFDRNRGRVVDFFQKESPEFLREHAALEGLRGCALDMGIVGFATRGREALDRAADTLAAGGESLLSMLRAGKVEIDLYVELLMAFLSGISFDRYREKVRLLSRLDQEALYGIHDAFSELDFRGYLAKGAHFLHFGSLGEYVSSCAALIAEGVTPFYCTGEAELHPSVSDTTMQLNCRETACVVAPGARRIYLEGCERSEVRSAGGGNLFVGLTGRTLRSPVPPGICVDERIGTSGGYLLVYGTNDTWRVQDELRALTYCNRPLSQWAAERGIDAVQLFPRPHCYDLVEARLFVAGADEAFAEGYWNPLVVDDLWRRRFGGARRRSIREIAAEESLSKREERRCRIRRELLREGVLAGRGWISIPEWDFRRSVTGADLSSLVAVCEATDDDLLRIFRRRLLESLGSAGESGDSIAALNVDYLGMQGLTRPLRRSVKPDQIVWARSPVRLDLAGGWTDTPPFTLREGGEIVNLAVSLNGQSPIQVFCRPLAQREVRFHSIDLGVGERVEGFEALEDFNNPISPFALPKAALCLLGLTRARSSASTLAGELERIGCGLEVTLLSAVPKGSGLGTSSILGATILGALERFFGIDVPREELFRQVLQMEQMLTTGGGWQDQIGGVAGGAKYLVSLPGLKPDPVIYQLDPYLFEESAAASCFTLYYTGITRLAKNILQDVVDRVNSMEPAYLFTLRYLKRLARSAREAISRRDLPALARILDASWESNKLIHPSTTNEEVEDLLGRLAGLYSGMKLLGAGGGGFVLFLSPSPEVANRLREKLDSIDHARARLVDMSIDPHGLRVTAS